MVEILSKDTNTTLKSEEILQIVEQIFEASRKQDNETVRFLLSHFSKEMTEKIGEKIKERMLPKPQEMEMAQLVEILKNKKILFYTGAGISIASGVHNMDQLQKTLGIDMSKKQTIC